MPIEYKKDNSSVLMNLLLTGKDVNNGYSVMHSKVSRTGSNNLHNVLG